MFSQNYHDNCRPNPKHPVSHRELTEPLSVLVRFYWCSEIFHDIKPNIFTNLRSPAPIKVFVYSCCLANSRPTTICPFSSYEHIKQREMKWSRHDNIVDRKQKLSKIKFSSWINCNRWIGCNTLILCLFRLIILQQHKLSWTTDKTYKLHSAFGKMEIWRKNPV